MSTDTVKNKQEKMTVEEYSELIDKWQQAYYEWNSSYLTYYNSMLLYTLMKQKPDGSDYNRNIPSSSETIDPTPSNPPVDIRSVVRLKVASVWRRFLAELIDFILLHVFKILVVALLSNYLHIIDPSRLSLNTLISSLIYEEVLSFPLELFCIELGYLLSTVVFESFCLTRYGATPGKRLLRLRVLKCDYLQIEDNGDVTIEPGTILDSAAALTRSAFKTLMATFLFPAVIVALLTSENRQTSYDMAASAVVVEFERQEELI